MAEGQDKEQQTEEPTQKKLEEAHNKGNVPTSKEVGHFFVLATLALIISWFAVSAMKGSVALLTPFLSDAHTMPTDQRGLGLLLYKLMFGSIGIIILPLIATIVAALAAGFLQHGMIFSSEPITPKLSKLSPLEGVKRLFSMRSVVEFTKNIIKIIIVGFIAFSAVYPELNHIVQLPDSSVEAMLSFLKRIAVKLTLWIAIAMFFIALFDTIYQRFQHIKSLRMTKQEIKDEYKQSEGDPMIKMRLRRLRIERARRRMMAAVPESDVVITNPTHFAVALKYTGGQMTAPIVTAKGQDLIALKIREVAEEHKIPIVENAPLARALFSSTEIDEEIPAMHYEAVAKVISYVYKLKGKI
ncbi:MAG: flagellar biosynthesis protein FlhB [Rickettsiales bacterium]|nr:flagellar biosynthesis protein FlhB [Rickettsiales bacterium]